MQYVGSNYLLFWGHNFEFWYFFWVHKHFGIFWGQKNYGGIFWGAFYFLGNNFLNYLVFFWVHFKKWYFYGVLFFPWVAPTYG
jgi:hypothetical protein